jgi:Txe/YoeB family toxin of toxin-antitoxin system
MVRYKLVFTKQAQKDAKKISKSGLRLNVETILDILRENPYKRPPHYEKLVGDLEGAYSRRRVIYQVIGNEKIVKIIRMWTHYE